MSKLHFEDLAVGQKFGSARRRVTAEEIKAFAREFDPQPFHIDEAAATESLFRGLAASGWHTAAMTMRLFVDGEFRPEGGIIGGGGGELTWHRPVRPGDELHVEAEVLDVRESRSRADQGVVRMQVTTFNQHGETVQTFVPTLLVRRRGSGAADLSGRRADC